MPDNPITASQPMRYAIRTSTRAKRCSKAFFHDAAVRGRTSMRGSTAAADNNTSRLSRPPLLDVEQQRASIVALPEDSRISNRGTQDVDDKESQPTQPKQHAQHD